MSSGPLLLTVDPLHQLGRDFTIVASNPGDTAAPVPGRVARGVEPGRVSRVKEVSADVSRKILELGHAADIGWEQDGNDRQCSPGLLLEPPSIVLDGCGSIAAGPITSYCSHLI